jgi:hypothetical protein
VVVPDRLGRLAVVLHESVQVVEVLGSELVELHLAKSWPDGVLDLSPVGPERRWGEVKPFGLLQPLVEELAEGSSDAI